jgi:hypothetical protein
VLTNPTAQLVYRVQTVVPVRGAALLDEVLKLLHELGIDWLGDGGLTLFEGVDRATRHTETVRGS